jgi:Flp pilus assembly protein TadG
MFKDIVKYKDFFLRYCRNTSAAIAIAFVIMAPVLLTSAGMALDYAQAYLVQQRLAQAIDAAALAAAASATEEDDIRSRVEDFFLANYPPEKIGVTFVPEVVVDGNEIYVSGRADYLTTFLKVIGVKEIPVSASTVVQREVQGLEVVLVLDNTGSMSTRNNIEALKDASRSFVNILFDQAADPTHVRIGIVPYSNSVRVGRYGLGQRLDGSYYGTPFVSLPPDMSFTNTRASVNWYGCVIEYHGDNYRSSATYVPNSKGQLWLDGAGNPNGHGWDPRRTNNDPYDYDVLDNHAGPWDVYSFGRTIARNDRCSSYSGFSDNRCSNCTGWNSRCNSDYCFCWHSNANQGCPNATIQPISSDRAALLGTINTMQAEGHTLGNVGMAWGYRLLSPEPPFEEGSAWDSEYWKKAIIMMTDGDNTVHSTYSSYWDTRKNAMTVTRLNQRFEETCNALKEKGVLIYTVTFTSGINNTTKGYYRRCATSEDQYYDAPTQQELISVFEKISRELSNLHIKR